MDLDYRALTFALQVGNSVGLIGVGIYSWISNRHKANASAIEELKDSVVADRTIIESRFSRIESEIKHLPTHSDIGEVYERINAVAETLSQVEGQLIQMNTGLQLIHEHLLNQRSRQ